MKKSVNTYVLDNLDLLVCAAPEDDVVAPGEEEWEPLAGHQVRRTEHEQVHVRQLKDQQIHTNNQLTLLHIIAPRPPIHFPIIINLFKWSGSFWCWSVNYRYGTLTDSDHSDADPWIIFMIQIILSKNYIHWFRSFWCGSVNTFNDSDPDLNPNSSRCKFSYFLRTPVRNLSYLSK